MSVTMLRPWGFEKMVGHVVTNLCSCVSKWLPKGKTLRTFVVHLCQKASSNKPWASSMRTLPSDSLARFRKMIGFRRSFVGDRENVLVPWAPALAPATLRFTFTCGRYCCRA